MIEKTTPSCHEEPLHKSEALELQRAESHLRTADNVRALIKEGESDPDEVIASLVIETNAAHDASIDDRVIADEVGFGQLLEDGQDDDDTVSALSRQAREPLGQALREAGDYWGDDALKTLLDKLDAVQEEHTRRDDRLHVAEYAPGEHASEVYARPIDPILTATEGGVEFIAHRPTEDSSKERLMRTGEGIDRTREAREILGIPAEFRHFQLVDSSEKAQRDDQETMVRGMRNNFTEGRKMWQERTFGSSEVGPFIDNVAECLMRQVGERVGQELIDETTGETKRPIMDISLDAHSAELVQRTIAERSASLRRALATLQEIAETGAKKSHGDCTTLLVDMGVWNRGHGTLLDGDCPAGTIADLYIDSTDLDKYEQLDALVARISGRAVDSRVRFAEGIVNLAGYTFPSGVELMHGTHVDSLNHIVERGAIAPRSQVLHGVQRKTQLNGGFIHMTAPGSAAYEYTNGAQKVVFGIPIDVIMEHSPYLQLEHVYTDNTISRPNEETGYVDQHSMQYELGRLQINNIATAPVVFQAALRTMHTNLSKGLRHAYLKNGLYNNYSFAAGDHANTAGAYTYPLEQLSMYTNSFEPIKKATERYPEKQRTLCDIAHVAVASRQHQVVNIHGRLSNGSGRLLSEISLPNFDIDNEAGVTIFAPIASREVAFTEGDVGNIFDQSGLSASLDTIKPDKIAKFSGELLTGGLTPDVVLDESIRSINEQGGRVQEFIYAFNRNREAFAAAGISIEDIVQRVSPEKLEEINLRAFDNSVEKDLTSYMNQDDHVALTKAYADRLYLLNPDDFAMRAEMLEGYGYIMNEQQRAYVAAYQGRQRDYTEEPIELPDFDLRF